MSELIDKLDLDEGECAAFVDKLAIEHITADIPHCSECTKAFSEDAPRVIHDDSVFCIQCHIEIEGLPKD